MLRLLKSLLSLEFPRGGACLVILTDGEEREKKEWCQNRTIFARFLHFSQLLFKQMLYIHNEIYETFTNKKLLLILRQKYKSTIFGIYINTISVAFHNKSVEITIAIPVSFIAKKALKSPNFLLVYKTVLCTVKKRHIPEEFLWWASE